MLRTRLLVRSVSRAPVPYGVPVWFDCVPNHQRPLVQRCPAEAGGASPSLLHVVADRAIIPASVWAGRAPITASSSCQLSPSLHSLSTYSPATHFLHLSAISCFFPFSFRCPSFPYIFEAFILVSPPLLCRWTIRYLPILNVLDCPPTTPSYRLPLLSLVPGPISPAPPTTTLHSFSQRPFWLTSCLDQLGTVEVTTVVNHKR